jgi:hypothetical protein
MMLVRQERESGLVKLASCCACLGFISLVVASVLPMFVVTSLKGHGKLLIADFDVDLSIGDGLWKKNVCFGESRPDESILNQLGLTCEGALQTEHCESDDLSDKDQDHCDDFYLLQGMESLAIFSTFVATFIGSLARTCASMTLLRTTLRLGAIVSLAIALSAAASVIRLVKESDMVDERSFSCSRALGAELCHGYGVSFGMQGAAVAQLALALMMNIILLCVSPVESTTTTYQYVRVPLLQQSVGVPGHIIVHAPTNTTQGVILSAPGQQQQHVQTYLPRAQASAELI